MILLALDPSLTCTGYAVGTSDRHLIESGRITPTCTSGKVDATLRAWSMCKDIDDLIREHDIEQAVVETPAPQAPRGKHGSKGQAKYGVAVGVIACHVIESLGIGKVTVVAADDWTGQVPKQRRALCVAADFPNYSTKRDPGLNVADAIALMQWWFIEQKKRGAA